MSDEAPKVAVLRPLNIPDDARFDAATILDDVRPDLEGAETVIIIAEFADGRMMIEGNCNAGQRVVIMERAKYFLIFPED